MCALVREHKLQLNRPKYYSVLWRIYYLAPMNQNSNLVSELVQRLASESFKILVMNFKGGGTLNAAGNLIRSLEPQMHET